MKKQTNKQHKKKIIYPIFLALPAIISLAWIISLTVASKSIALTPEGLRLSPIRDTAPLLTSLIVFTIGYLLFIALIFQNAVKKTIKKFIKS